MNVIFNFDGSVHCDNIPIYIQQYAIYTGYFIWKLLYMFRVVPSPIVRRANKCICSIWYVTPLAMRICEWWKLQTQILHNKSWLVNFRARSALKTETQNGFKVTWLQRWHVHWILQYIFNKMQLYTGYFIWKLLYMFRVVPSPIVSRANKCICSIWYLSHR